MARIRSIHPGILTDESFMTLTVESPLAIALMIGLWMEADDAGTFEWKPITLKARCLPAANTNVSDLLDALQSVEMVKRFEIDGKPYGVIRNFIKYQRPRDPKIIYDQSDEMFSFAGGGDGYGDGPLNFSRDLTATERKRRQRERDKGGECHGSGVTKTGVTRGIPEMSRQMEDVGCRREEEVSVVVVSRESPRSQTEIKHIEAECRKAAGLEQAISASLFDLSPILGLMDAGADLTETILPAIAARPNPRASSWRYFVPQIQTAMQNRASAAVMPPQRPPDKPFGTASPAKPSGKAVWMQAIIGGRNEPERQDPRIIDLQPEPDHATAFG